MGNIDLHCRLSHKNVECRKETAMEFNSVADLRKHFESDHETHSDAYSEKGEHIMMDVQDEIHAKVKKFQHDHNEADYKTAFDRVLKADPRLKEQYAESVGWQYSVGRATITGVGGEVHAKVKKFQADHNEPDYKTALDRVLGADRELRERYAFER